MASSGVLKLTIMVVFLWMLIAAPSVDAAVTCGQVTNILSPCINYLRNGGNLPPACCKGVRAINAAARTRPDRKAACECLKSAAARFAGLKLNLANSLPARCGVNIPYKISPYTDCSKVQ